MCVIKKIIRIFACLCWLSTGDIFAGMGPVHAVNPQPTKSAWITSLRQATFLGEVAPTFIFDSDVYNGVITISEPGVYQLAQNLSSRIVIAANNVSLDLGQYTITRMVGSEVIITLSNNVKNVTIARGYIKNTDTVATGGSGIYVGSGCSNIVVHDVSVIGCTNGIMLAGVNGLPVNGGILSRLNLISNTIGVFSSYAQSIMFQECFALYSVRTGFELNNCQTHSFYDCTALKTTGTATVVGFRSTGGTSNLFQRCVAEQTKTSSTTYGDKACGFLLTGTELKTKIINCIVNETDIISSPTATTSGIELQQVLQQDAYLLSEVARNLTGRANIRTLAWSPVNGYRAYVATNDTGSSGVAAVIVNQFNGVTDTVVTTSLQATREPLSCAWSPDGKYLTVVFGVNPEVFVYFFDGLALTFVNSIATPTAQSYCVGWSPNGKYFAVNDATGGGSGGVRIFGFDGTTINLLDSSNFTTAAGGGYVFSWSADGTYIVVGPRANNLIAIPVSSAGKFGSQVSVASGIMTGVACSPRGKYVATADTAGNLAVWTWTGATLFQNATIAASAESVAWSPDGRYIAVGTLSGGLIKVYEFTGTGLTLLKTLATPIGGANEIFALTWSPDGQYIAAARMDTTSSGMVVVRGMYGPSDCLVDSCRVINSLASSFNVGRGLVAGGSNVCTRNISGNNGINYSYGIPNVYDGRFEILRSVVQPFDNISMPTSL